VLAGSASKRSASTNAREREELPPASDWHPHTSEWDAPRRVWTLASVVLGSEAMFKLIFGVLGLLIALAVVSSLMKSQLGALGQIGQTPTQVRKASGGEASTPQPSQAAQKSMFERTDEAWQQSQQRYKRAESQSDR
jgi:hypothetical protein